MCDGELERAERAARVAAGATRDRCDHVLPARSAPSSAAPRAITAAISSSESGSSSITAQRESRAALTSKYGFSVVAPISVISPLSTAGRSASCCALLKRWISSRNRIVRRAVRCRGGHAPAAARRGRRRREPKRPTSPRTRLPWTRRRCARALSSRRRVGRRGSSRVTGRLRSRAAAPSPRRGRDAARPAGRASADARAVAAAPSHAHACAPHLRRGRPSSGVCSLACHRRPGSRRSTVPSCPARPGATTSGTSTRKSCSGCKRAPASGCTATSCCSRSCTSRPSSGSSWPGTTPRRLRSSSARTTSAPRSGCCAGRACACASSPGSSTCSSRCRPGSTRRSARCSATDPGSTRPG